MTIAVEFKNTSKTYSLPQGGLFTALKPLNLQVYSGECFGLLGHNGAGKTTAINILAGVHSASTGDVFINDLSVTEYPETTKRLLGVVQQELLVDSFFKLPVMLNIQSKLFGVKPDKEWIHYLLEQLKLKDHIHKTSRELSGGMKRRMMIARALVHKPRILVLDEPTAGVDVQLRHSMWDFIQALHKNGITIILTTHYLEEAEQFCDRIAIIKQGEIISLKKNKELLALGGKPKIIYVISLREGLIDLQKIKQIISIEQETQNLEIYIESKKNNHQKDHELKLFCHFEAKNPKSFHEASLRLIQFTEKYQISVEDVFTEQSNLEDIFIQINEDVI